ncbi:alpha/beta hydrolase fold domain-containing protein [Paenarthrobacter sp. NPDC091669]|uniref:alpha/beta hydrolase fold domain-containing protein n=1 Tax=Paenarthrobacter sp. NPDC091669 TaxID=3364384 RepID=UPI0037F4DFE4
MQPPVDTDDLLKPVTYEAQKGLVYADLPGNAGTLDLYLPKESQAPAPVVVWSAGSGWSLDNGNSLGDQIAQALCEHGFAVAAIAIRSSLQAQFPAQLHDAKAAVRWLRINADAYNLDTGRIAAMGNSSGGWTAAMLGVTSNLPWAEGNVGTLGSSSAVQAVIDLYGPTDFSQMDDNMPPGATASFNERFNLEDGHSDPLSPESRLIGAPVGQDQNLVAAVNPITYVGATTPPFLIAHGDMDTLVPHHQSELLFEALSLGGTPATFHSVHGYDHNHDFLNDDAAVSTVRHGGGRSAEMGGALAPITWQTILRFLNENLKTK